MITLEHVEFYFEASLLSDAHVGDGETAALRALRPNIAPRPEFDDETNPEVATIVRDAANRPTFPASTLKGALRSAIETSGFTTLSTSDSDRLFGVTDNHSTMGLFSFYSAELVGTPDDCAELPYFDPEAGTWIATHVAISRSSGAAEHQKLFNQETIPAGSRFKIAGVFFGSAEKARQDIPMLLAPFAHSLGLPVGAGEKLAMGRLRAADSTISVRTKRFDPNSGEIEHIRAETLTIASPSFDSRDLVLNLNCEGPFLSADPSRATKSSERNRIAALRRNSRQVHIQSSSIYGALRSRCAWLAAVSGFGADDRFRKTQWRNPGELTCTERLFGVAGWRGLLRVIEVAGLTAEPADDLHSIAIDRWSGANIDGALFSYEIFVGVSFSLSLRIESRVAEGGVYPTTEDKALFKILTEDLLANGVMLGHRTNCGFGWFGVTILQNEAAVQ
jgi:CRISPR/Cas system CSM-associated protein Csm3 (group 7 of RAMP superfamily)